MMYYVLKCFEPLHGRFCARRADMQLSSKTWCSGQAFDAESNWDHRRPPAEPLQIHVELDDDNSLLIPEYSSAPFPFISRRLYEAFRKAGVDNLVAYETEFLLPNGKINKEYLAIQVVGLISAADMKASKYHADAYSASNEPAGENEPVFFDKMIIDENKTDGILLFRLSQNPSTILIHESVKRMIESLGIDTLEFLDPGDVAG